MRRLSIFMWALSLRWESWNCCANSCRNCSQTKGTWLMTGSSWSIHQPISRTHPATSGPLIKVSVRETFFLGELNPAMSWLRRRYPLTSSMKLSALVQSPVNIWGRLPMVLTSPAMAIGIRFAPGPAPPGGPPPGGPSSGGPPPAQHPPECLLISDLSTLSDSKWT